MIFLPRALEVTSVEPCGACPYDVLEILEMVPSPRGGAGLKLRLVRMCGCGVFGREEDEPCIPHGEHLA